MIERVVTAPGTVGAGLAENLSADISKAGYKAIAAFPAYSTISSILAQGCSITGANVYVAVKNITNQQVSGVQYYVNVVYIRN